MGAPFGKGEAGVSRREQGASVETRQGRREDVISGEMRRRPEDEEDDPFMASGCQHAQSELMCTAKKIKVNVSAMYIFSVLIVFIVSGK